MSRNFIPYLITLLFLPVLLSNCAKKRSAWDIDERVSSQLSSPGDSSTPQFEELRKGVFEVIAPWELPSKVSYENELDRGELPYALRSDKYLSIGTAFSITKRIIVSAAHVFDAHKLSVYTPHIRLRHQDGKIYEIDKIIKYSQRHDLIAFTLKDYPRNMRPIPLKASVSAGEKVYAVGNALGQGIVIRDGKITSFTPEEVEGAWQFIRFTAPASPGNSGGALLNREGRAIGIVTRRSENENLNYAVPIQEFIKLSKDHAIIHDRSWSESENGKQFSRTWKEHISLPRSLSSLSKESHKRFVAEVKERRKLFERKHSNDLFPNAPKVRAFLTQQKLSYRFSSAASDNSGNWHYFNTGDLQSLRLEDGRALHVAMAEANWTQMEAYVEKPNDLSLKNFIDDSKLFMDRILSGLSLTRNVGGQELRIVSLGHPIKQQWWTDDLGRNWKTSQWTLNYADAIVSSHCLPYPEGLACMVNTRPLGYKDVALYYARLNAKKWGFGYMGSLSAWQEFFQLSDRYRPKHFGRSDRIEVSSQGLSFDFSGVTGHVKDPEINENSQLGIIPVFSPSNPSRLTIKKVAIVPDKRKDTAYVKEKVFRPHDSSVPELHDLWKDLVAHKAPFDGQTRKKGEFYETYNIVRAKRSPASGPKTHIEVASCMHDNSLEKNESIKRCRSFK